MTRSSPYDAASNLSRTFFCWVLPIIKDASKKKLTTDDVPRPPADEKLSAAVDFFEREWAEEAKNEKPKIARVIMKNWGLSFAMSVLLSIISECVFRIAQPLLIGYTVRYFSALSKASVDSSPISASNASWALFGIFSTALFCGLEKHHWIVSSKRHGLRARYAMVIMLYRKLFRMSNSSLVNKTSGGQFLNLVSSELCIFDEFCDKVSYLVIGPLQSLIVTYILWCLLGWSCLAGLAILFLIIPFQSSMGRFFLTFKSRTSVCTDKRIKLMNEVISAIRLVKLYCWEPLFAEAVDKERRAEISQIRQTWVLRALNIAVMNTSARLMTFATLTTYVISGGRLSIEAIFITIALFNNLRMTATYLLPEAIGSGAELMVALRKVEKILLMDERPERKSSQLPQGIVVFKNYCAKWSKESSANVLNDVTLKAKQGQLVMVIGKVGAGKSSFLNAISGELEQVSGLCDIGGSISYAPQESWCFSATIRDNITLDSAFDEERFRKVIEVCGLERDLELFPDREETLVGEKGYTLSGGQKARVTLARAVYHKADVYLLDDPLSAVDTAVAKHILEKCVKVFLKDKTVILVTHQLQFLDAADKVLLLEAGKSVATGTYGEIQGREDINFLSMFEASNGDKHIPQTERNNNRVGDSKVAEAKESVAVSTKQTNRSQQKEQIRDSTPTAARKLGLFRIFVVYLRSSESNWLIVATILVTLVSQSLMHYVEFWAADWSQDFGGKSVTRNVLIYCLLVAALLLFTFLRTMSTFVVCLRSSINMHNQLLRKILGAPMKFFETTPLGSVLGRFSKDVNEIDQMIPYTICDLNITIVMSMGIASLIACVEPSTLIVAVSVLIFCIPVRNLCARSQKYLRSFESEARAPIYNHVLKTFQGMPTIRCMRIEASFEEHFSHLVEKSQSCRLLLLFTDRAVGFFLDCFSLLYMGVICSALACYPSGVRGTDAGLVLSSALQLIGLFQFAVRQTSVFEDRMLNSVGNLLDYDVIETEEESCQSKAGNSSFKETENWPSNGQIEYKNVSLKYSPTDKNVLEDISFKVAPGEKVGIVGRTGAGKTSLSAVLFRLVNYEGGIKIDGVDIKKVSMAQLRPSISIIPQDPVLFSGKLRRNLDPFNDYTNDELWRALENANLEKLVQSMEDELDGHITEGGSNLSVGQRQLLCLARATLRKNKILVLDEATANVDHETDQLIQRTIRTRFAGCTVLTIAHRINTVIDMDKILVMEAGRLVQYGPPYELISDKAGVFYGMAEKTGPAMLAALIDTAKGSYSRK